MMLVSRSILYGEQKFFRHIAHSIARSCIVTRVTKIDKEDQ